MFRGKGSSKDSIIGLWNTSPPWTIDHYISKGLFFTVPFTCVSCLSFKKKLQSTAKGKTQFKETEKASESVIYVRDAGITRSEIFFKPMMNVLRGLMEKADNMQLQVSNINREKNSKKEPKRNARDQKHCNRNEKCF